MMKRLLFTIILIISTVGFVQAQNGSISGGSPLLPIATTSVSPGTNTPATAEGTDFGAVAQGTTVSQTYRFTSAVADNLSVTSVGFAPGDWVQQSATPASITGVNTTSDFTVDFTPTSAGVQTVTVQLDVFNNATFITESFFFQITGEGAASAPKIEVRGDDTLIAENPVVLGDNTDFGNVTVGNTNIRSYTIKNIGSAPLEVTNVFRPAGSTNFTVLPLPVALPTTLAPNASFTFQVEFAPDAAATRTAVIGIVNNDANYAFNVSGVGVAAAPNMDVIGNGTSIASGSTTPNAGDDTLFPDTDITGGSVAHTFTIANNGSADLELTNIPLVNITGVDAADFTVTATPTTPIASGGGTTTFTITFDPTTVGVKNATVSIPNNGVDNPYEFDIQGKGIDGVPVGSELLITQYHEGLGNNQWIEVKNISSSSIVSGFYNLCLFTDSSANEDDIINTAPQQSIAIGGTGPGGSILPGEVVVFKNVTTPTLPLSGNLGSGLVTSTSVCTFDGDDIILISTSTGVNSYNDRIDIVGIVAASGGFPPSWGVDKGFVKGCGTTTLPTKEFNVFTAGGKLVITDYIELLLDEVNTANSDANVAIGTQRFGSTTWTTTWSNGTSDRTRVAILNGAYTAANGSFGACDLTVNGTLNFNSNTSNYVEVSRSLAINGTFDLGDQESLYSVNVINPGSPVSISGVITKYETTTSLNDSDDYTYWSSPVKNENMSNVFKPAEYQQTRLYYWDQAADNLIPGGGAETKGEWISATGLTMKPAKGYISQSQTNIAYPAPSGATVKFTGIPNNGNIKLNGEGSSTDIVFNNNGNSQDDLNLIGNPYPSAIDADLFINSSDNQSSLNGTLWFWTHLTPNNQNTVGEQYNSGDYASYNLSGGTSGSASGSAVPTNFIGSGQGFMVQTNSTLEKVIFTDGMRIKGLNTQFFKEADIKKSNSKEKDRVWINIESSEGNASNQILIGFFKKATDGFDSLYDGEKISTGWVSLYSKIEDKKYAIQGLSDFNTDKKVPLGFDTYIDDASVTYKISIDRLEGTLKENDVYLVDNELNITHDLKQSEYSFAVTGEGNYSERFTLQFTNSTLAVDDLELNNNFVVVNEDDNLLIKSNTVINQIKVFDTTGRLLIDTKPNESEFRINTLNIRKGTVLILNTTFENGAEISKKAIRY